MSQRFLGACRVSHTALGPEDDTALSSLPAVMGYMTERYNQPDTVARTNRLGLAPGALSLRRPSPRARAA